MLKKKKCKSKVQGARVPACKTVVGGIKRHVLTRAKKKEIREQDVLKAAVITKAGKKQRGSQLTSKKSAKGSPERFKKCFFISPQINVYLKSSRKVKPGTALSKHAEDCQAVHWPSRTRCGTANTSSLSFTFKPGANTSFFASYSSYASAKFSASSNTRFIISAV